MDIFSFIRSRAVAEHCWSIGKTWNTLEKAVIIDRSNRTIADKHAAWMELVEHYPDMPAIPNYHQVEFDSIHAKIMERIAYENRAIELFKTPEEGVFYNCSCQYCGKHGRTKRVEVFETDPFATFEQSLANLNEKWTEHEVTNLCFQRIIVGDSNSNIRADADYAGNLYSIDAYAPDDVYAKWFPDFKRCRGESGSLHWHGFEFADLFFIDIPVPFAPGDILTVPDRGYLDLFVMLDDREDPRWLRWHERSLRGEISDGVDFQSWAFFVNDHGTLFKEHTGPYDAFEYYTDELKGNDRLLYYVRLFLHDELELHGLLTMHGRLIAEQLMDDNFAINSGNSWFLKDLIYENRKKQEQTARTQPTGRTEPQKEALKEEIKNEET